MDKELLTEKLLHGITYASFFVIMTLILSQWGLKVNLNSMPTSIVHLGYEIVLPCIKILASLYTLTTSVKVILSDMSFMKKAAGLAGFSLITYLVVFII